MVNPNKIKENAIKLLLTPLASKEISKLLLVSVVLILILGTHVITPTIAKKRNSNNDQSQSNTPLPSINTSPSTRESTKQTFNFKEFKDNLPNSSVIFVGNIVKNLDESKKLHIEGEVKNIGKRAVDFVQIIATFYDAVNQTLGSEVVNPSPMRMEPQQSAPFDMIVPDRIPINDISSVKYHLLWFNAKDAGR